MCIPVLTWFLGCRNLAMTLARAMRYFTVKWLHYDMLERLWLPSAESREFWSLQNLDGCCSGGVHALLSLSPHAARKTLLHFPCCRPEKFSEWVTKQLACSFWSLFTSSSTTASLCCFSFFGGFVLSFFMPPPFPCCCCCCCDFIFDVASPIPRYKNNYPLKKCSCQLWVLCCLN